MALAIKAARFKASFPQPLWDGSSLGAEPSCCGREQGRATRSSSSVTLRSSSSVADRVVVECKKELAGLLRTCAGIDQVVVRQDPLPAFEVHAPLLSLPGIFHTTLDTIPNKVPYLSAEPALTEALASGDETMMRSRSASPGVAIRSTEVIITVPFLYAGFLPLTCLPLTLPSPPAAGGEGRVRGRVQLCSLQRGPGIEELHEADFAVTDLGSRFETFSDTAAVLMNLDLLITIDTAVAHCAGALGRQVWVALPFAADWRWLLDREDSPWYPTMRLFRQKLG